MRRVEIKWRHFQTTFVYYRICTPCVCVCVYTLPYSNVGPFYVRVEKGTVSVTEFSIRRAAIVFDECVSADRPLNCSRVQTHEFSSVRRVKNMNTRRRSSNCHKSTNTSTCSRKRIPADRRKTTTINRRTINGHAC